MHRKWHQDQLSFSLVYAFSENFMLPLSHDEVVYGKHSLVNKMPGDEWQRMANLRLLFAYMFTHPGTKLVFMGGEFAQVKEWNFEQSLDWHLLEYAPHKGVQACMKALNHLLKSQPALHEYNFSAEGFEWIDASDRENSTFVYIRKGLDPADQLVVALNLIPITRHNYRVGLPFDGTWAEIFNSDSLEYYGSGATNPVPMASQPESWQGRANSIAINLPPLGAVVLKRI
jgi:1,4-alpha-glucan branching enzyme